MDSLLIDALEQFLGNLCDPHKVRAIESGGSADLFWQGVIESGFADAVMAEQYGGAGFGLMDAAAIFLACGTHPVPVPLSQTIIVRAALAAQGIEVPEGAITIADVKVSDDLSLVRVPYGCTSAWVIAQVSTDWWLLPLKDASVVPTGVYGSLMADVHWSRLPATAVRLSDGGFMTLSWRELGALVTAVQMAGAMEKLLNVTVDYANQRIQFGKPIGKLQVIQQQLSVMAEQTFACRTAAMLGLSGDQPNATLAAIAKARTSEATPTVTSVAHAVHGAIGVTEEYDLQLYTRRIHEWRWQYGAETYWHTAIGQGLLADTATPLEYIHKMTAAAVA